MVNVSLVPFCREVREGEAKKLDPSVLRAMDLDVPKNTLRFTVVTAPNHGGIIRRSSDRQGSKRREASHQTTVVDFTMADLTNGTFFHVTQRTEMGSRDVKVNNYLSALGYSLSHYSYAVV